MLYHLSALVLGFLLDLIIGDPYNFPHPIKLIGKMISMLDKRFMDKEAEKVNRDANREKSLGGLLAFIVIFSTACVMTLIIKGTYFINVWIGVITEAVFTCYILAAKSLKDESMKVYAALDKGDIEGARKAVSMIVGRDTQNLDEEGIIKAAVETVAENTSDGVVAPFLYTAIGGPILGMVYKAINTMDSMVGYHNSRYENFGKTAAKLDDVANFIPSRVCAVLMIVATCFMGKAYDTSYAKTIFLRDRFNHKSPNSAQTESVVAGALGVRLAGDASYFGEIVHKPYIGDPLRSIGKEDIRRVNRLMYGTIVVLIAMILIIGCWMIGCTGLYS